MRRAGHAGTQRAGFRPHTGYLVAMALFAATFVTLVLSAFHAPRPHGLPVGIVAPASVAGQVQGALDKAAPGGFDLRVYPSEAAARSDLAHGTVDGALIDDSDRPRLLLAQAAGTAPAQAVSTAFGAVAARSGQSLTVVDVVPPRAEDSLALSPFFMILSALFPSMAAGSASALVFRRSRAAWCVAAPIAAAVGIGAATAGIADGLAGLGHFPAIAGLTALFALAVAAPTAALGRIKPPLMALALLVLVLLSIPVSGGPSGLAPFDPGFLRALQPILPLGAAATAARRLVYFDGHGTSGPLWALAAWAVVGVAALAAVAWWRGRRAPEIGVASAAADGGKPRRTDASAGYPAAGTAVPGAAAGGSSGEEPFPLSGVVVGFDDSAAARRALRRAARLAAARHQVLHVVYSDHVILESDLTGLAHAAMEAARDQEALRVAEAAADIAAEIRVPHTFERSQEAADDAILSAAKSLATDEYGPVIVVGRAGRAAHHLLGSVPTRLLGRSPYLVLAVP